MSRPDPDAGHGDRLARLRRPARIVVAGASATRSNMGRRLLAAVGRSFTGELLAVHPSAATIDGHPCVPDLPAAGQMDVLVVATPAAGVLELVAGSSKLDPAAVVVVTALDPAALAGAVATAYQGQYDPARHPWVIGPGSNGYLTGAAGLAVTSNPSVADVPVTDRGVLVVGQSGGLALSALWEPLRRAGVPVGMAVTTGTQPVLPWWTVAAAGARHGRFDAVAVLAESVPGPAALAALGQAAGGAGVPVLALQVGSSPAGGGAAQSHSGALATPGRLFEAACRRYGIRAARSLPELIDLCGHATAGPARRIPPDPAEPAPAGVAVVSPSGGALGYALDQLAGPRLRLAPLAATTLAGLAPLLDPSVGPGNPLDLGAAAATDPATLAAAVRLLRADPAVGRVVVVLAATAGLAEVVAALATDRFTEPVELVCLAAGPADLGRARAAAGGDPAVRVWSDLAAVRTALTIEADPVPAGSPGQPRPDPPPAAAAAVARVSGWPAGARTEAESADLLRMLGIARPAEATLRPGAGLATLRSLAARVPLPWVLKGMARDATHKHAAGLLVTGVRTIEEAQARIAGFADARPDLTAVLVQEHVRYAGPELLLAVRHHPVLGPHLLLGAGGTAVEQAGNVEVCLLPASDAELAALLRRVEVALPEDPGFLRQLAATASRLEDLVRGCAVTGSALTVELNPVVRDPRDGRLLALDALCIKAPIKDVPL